MKILFLLLLIPFVAPAQYKEKDFLPLKDYITFNTSHDGAYSMYLLTYRKNEQIEQAEDDSLFHKFVDATKSLKDIQAGSAALFKYRDSLSKNRKKPKNGYAPASSKTTADAIMRYIDTLAMVKDPIEREAIIKKNGKVLKEYFSWWDHMPVSFYFDKDNPIGFCVVNEKSLALVLPDVCGDAIYDNVKLDQKQRAAKAVMDLILPVLSNCDKLPPNLINSLIITCTYCSGDLSEDYLLHNKIESAAFIFPLALAQKFVAGSITQEDLLKKSDALISDENFGFKKVELSVSKY